MRDALGDVQSVLVLGGGSDIAQATVRRLTQRRCRRVQLAVRDPAAVAAFVAELEDAGVTTSVTRYDATIADHDDLVAAARAELGDVDLIMVAFGDLGPRFGIDVPDATVRAVLDVNQRAAVSALMAAARALTGQGHGTIAVLSSVAGIRPRRDNALYASAKAGLDGFATALAHQLAGTGVDVMVVRPGFVHTKMTSDVDPAPFATTADAVAADIVAGLRRRARIVWSPPVLRVVFGGLRLLPEPLWRIVSRR